MKVRLGCARVQALFNARAIGVERRSQHFEGKIFFFVMEASSCGTSWSKIRFWKRPSNMFVWGHDGRSKVVFDKQRTCIVSSPTSPSSKRAKCRCFARCINKRKSGTREVTLLRTKHASLVSSEQLRFLPCIDKRITLDCI